MHNECKHFWHYIKDLPWLQVIECRRCGIVINHRIPQAHTHNAEAR